MTGWTSKRGSWGPISERVANPARRSDPPEPASAIRPCWVVDPNGRLPGLLLEWRNLEGAWRARVVHPIPDAEGWAIVEEWLPAEFLRPAEQAHATS